MTDARVAGGVVNVVGAGMDLAVGESPSSIDGFLVGHGRPVILSGAKPTWGSW